MQPTAAQHAAQAERLEAAATHKQWESDFADSFEQSGIYRREAASLRLKAHHHRAEAERLAKLEIA